MLYAKGIPLPIKSMHVKNPARTTAVLPQLLLTCGDDAAYHLQAEGIDCADYGWGDD